MSDKVWDGIAGQRVSDADGNEWLVAEIIAEAKDLRPFDIPMLHLCTASKTIGGMNIPTFVKHMRMVLDADLSYPIILDDEGGIFDGRHRAAKALLEERETIKAVRFEKDPEPSIEGNK